MATIEDYGFKLVYINSDGSLVGPLKAEYDAPAFADFGDYIIPWEWAI